MNQHDEYSALRQAFAAGARIQRWVLNHDGERTSANGSWSIVADPKFTCPAHLYRIFPEDAHLVQNDGITDAQAEAVYDAVSRSNITRDVKTPERKRSVVRAAMESAQ